jgi:riboflavin biosynthesis pyrimidine reductase
MIVSIVRARCFIAAGVVDEIGLNVHPILLGTGTPLFRDAGHRVTLSLTENRTIDGGSVFMSYRVQPA